MRLKIGGRLNMIGVVALIGFVLMLCLSAYGTNSRMRDGVREETKTAVENAYSILAHYQAEEAAGRMTREAAQKAAISAVKAMRYSGQEYFWINDMRPSMVAHPFKPELEGKDLSQKADPDGVLLFNEMVDVVRAHGEGFVDYSWPKPGKDEPQPKLSYVKGFAPWGWIVGSGVYVDDLNAAIFSSIFKQTFIALVLIGIVMIVTVLLGRSVVVPLKQVTDRMVKLSEGDNDTPIPSDQRTDEIGDMARALSTFRDSALAREKAEAAKARADKEQHFVVETVSVQLERLSQGDLTSTIDTEFPASYAALKANFNKALANLRDLISSITEATATIRTGSDEIAQASEDLARRTESNAASLEQTSAALSQMKNRLHTSSQASERTVEQTNGTMTTVGDGRATAEEAVTAMGRVSESARGIDDVIEGLDKIAFQTRVLAMNAAVEAGRAGEAGRGFAVVADLVSALAMRAEEEAGRAREQLTATQSDIGAAVGAVQNVDGALAGIAQSVETVHELVRSMDADNRAQVTTISEIAGALNAMDQSTQQNAAMVEQTSAGARNLSNEIGGLAARARTFRVQPDTGRPSTRSATHSATSAPPASAEPIPA
ncbi:cache domain-containing protein [Stakelama pacifica]|uniref:Methyl-accepting chemotaxis sensory transducer with Cache sensor n=1 Tax=Stakelama pacifica TaxID=517720 RepID=A0A4R6FJN9_9SPHN|nr:methyl-accepting chemotaxis protein [Stakelama pacifica]TDN81613.1 methyl-accepting chemotaxis sensory transducer with Cache sensor [Stakelama pacifica]GGO96052.1 chemotaxis protein [Stakelama pacifica]